MPLFANYRESVQCSPDDWETYHRSMVVTQDTTVRDLMDFKHKCNIGINRNRKYPRDLDGITFSSSPEDVAG